MGRNCHLLCEHLYKCSYVKAKMTGGQTDEALASARKEVVEGFKQNAAKCLFNLFR